MGQRHLAPEGCWSDDQLVERAVADYQAVLGREFLASRLDGYDDAGDSRELLLEPPARIRVVCSDRASDLERIQDDWIDPCWNVEVLEERPELEGIHGFYVFGTSRDRWGRVESHRLQEVE